MALENAPPKGKGTIGGMKKQYVYAGGAVLLVLVAVVYYRSKQQSAQAASSTTGNMVTDPAGNTCTALDPNSGYCPGTAEDLAYQGNTINPLGMDSASSVGGQIIGYDQYGDPIYSQGPTSNTGPGTFTNNAEWAQAALQYMIQNEPSANATTISTALGAYVNGQPVTDAQKNICEQAIAFEGLPPVAGPNGNPPNFVQGSNPPPTGGTKLNMKLTARYNSIDVSWSAIAGASGYKVSVYAAPKWNLVTSQGTNNTQLTFGNLKSKTKYKVNVTANTKTKTPSTNEYIVTE